MTQLFTWPFMGSTPAADTKPENRSSCLPATCPIMGGILLIFRLVFLQVAQVRAEERSARKLQRPGWSGLSHKIKFRTKYELQLGSGSVHLSPCYIWARFNRGAQLSRIAPNKGTIASKVEGRRT